MSVAFRPHVILIYDSLYGLPHHTYLWIWIWQSGHVLFINVKMVLELKTLIYFSDSLENIAMRGRERLGKSFPKFPCNASVVPYKASPGPSLHPPWPSEGPPRDPKRPPASALVLAAIFISDVGIGFKPSNPFKWLGNSYLWCHTLSFHLLPNATKMQLKSHQEHSRQATPIRPQQVTLGRPLPVGQHLIDLNPSFMRNWAL